MLKLSLFVIHFYFISVKKEEILLKPDLTLGNKSKDTRSLYVDNPVDNAAGCGNSCG